WAAISYTVGQNAYGYRGFGDLFVFIFFGFVSVLGAYFLQMKEISLTAVAFAWVLGLLAVAVLNLNNMRDLESDRTAGKRTLAVILGPQQAKYYHYLLILSAVIILVFITIQLQLTYYWLSLLGIIPLAIHLFTIRSHIEPQSLDPELKKVALSVFALSLLLFISFSLG
ncbi:MAG: 1,4-dihydroxy-2-naphthoate octaprenyltransferase, partial [Flavobacteriaceae bacterium]